MARPRKLYLDSGLTTGQLEIRTLAMSNLAYFVALVAPKRVLGHCHLDLLKYFMKEESHQLTLWPRGHQKSTMIAYWAAWHLINNPDTTILYASATSSLAESQLSFIKNILDSEIARKYWPELLVQDEGKRSMWRSDSICVDHWKRTEEAIRDPSVKAVGMGANITGFHSDVVLLDDIVVNENSQTKTEREKVKGWYSLLTSILNPGGLIKAVGTIYNIEDLYKDLMDMEEELYDEFGEIKGREKVYSFSMKAVEDDGNFLWPRQRRDDGRWFGFNKSELSRIRSQYLDQSKFQSQYYNRASDPDNQKISNFNYYDRDKLIRVDHKTWSIDGLRLNVYAAIDFAATITKKADYTAIVVVGLNNKGHIYVLDIARFKTDKISVMKEELNRLYTKWGWLKLRAEVNAQQNLIVEQIKDFNRNEGIYYTIDKGTSRGEKEIRIMSTLEPRYASGHILHYRGGNCQILEDELIATKPPHDDVSDALASVIEIATPPSIRGTMSHNNKVVYNTKWGGIA